MNIQQADILKALYEKDYSTQREIASHVGHALGLVNKSLRLLEEDKYIHMMKITDKGREYIDAFKPKNAIILAAGFGMRMVPINHECPKAFLKVKGEILIERLINQLHEAGIKKIYVVVGFMKEQFDYLIDKYNVELIVNSDYVLKNNLYSLKKAEKYIENSYIVPSDVWFEENPFGKNEAYSWYMITDKKDNQSDVKLARSYELVKIPRNIQGNTMVGLSFISKKDAPTLKKRMKDLSKSVYHDNDFWEEALYDENGKMFTKAKVIQQDKVNEINTFEQLRQLDDKSKQLQSEAILVLADAIKCDVNDIKDIEVLKKGMTNRSFLFNYEGSKYIMRIPGEGTDQLINRKEEAEVYKTIAGKGFCDDPVYINPENGYKVTKFLMGVRTCNDRKVEDIQKCFKLLKKLHNMNLKVDHEFNLLKEINFYESLWNGEPSSYPDYKKTKEHVLELINYVDGLDKKKCLTHIDANCDNFLFYKENGEEKLQLTDWEYAGMQDPDLDIAMFAIYSMYEKSMVDFIIDIYYEDKCPEEIRTKIYCYVAIAGLLWSNWCEYKAHLGIEFGEYSLRQYRYAKDYYTYAKERM